MPHISDPLDGHLLISSFLLPLKPRQYVSLCLEQIQLEGIAGSENTHIEILMSSVRVLSNEVKLICTHEVF